MSTAAGSTVSRAPRPSSLADVLDLILDKGLVIDAFVRVSAVGIEVLTIDARIVIASVDTYLHYAEAVNRLDLSTTETQGLTGLFDGQSSNGQSSNGQSSNGQSSSGRSSGGNRARRDEGPRQLSGGQREDEQEERSGGRSKGLAGRISDRGRWDQ